MAKKPTIILLHGFIASGKSTYSVEVCSKYSAVYLSHDEFMVHFYGKNPAAEHFSEYYNKVTEMIWSLVEKLSARGINVLLDFGFWSRHSRDEARGRILSLNATSILYSVQSNKETMRRRCLERNRDPDYQGLLIDAHAFDKFYELFEDIQHDEEAILIRN